VIGRRVSVSEGAQVGSLVVLAGDVSIGSGSRVERSVVLNGTKIGDRCSLRDCIVAAGCRVGPGTQITGGAVLGEGVTLGADNVITRGARIFPGVALGDGAIKF
jgi:mannose-1-phosphate guanylyltransferase